MVKKFTYLTKADLLLQKTDRILSLASISSEHFGNLRQYYLYI